MVSKGLVIRLHAKPGRDTALSTFLEEATSIVEQEPGTTALFMLRFGDAEYGIVNAFPDENGRQAHMNGRAAVALFTQGMSLLEEPPTVEPVDIIAAKLPD